MKTVVVALFDKKAKAFKTPFYVQQVELATRAMFGAVNATEPTDLTQYPEDFALYQLATYDDESGKFEQPPQPRFIAEALQFKKQPVELQVGPIPAGMEAKRHAVDPNLGEE